MSILRILLIVTDFTQEQMANYLGVSRASINAWLSNDSSMTRSSRQNIANKFQFPMHYFNVDIKNNVNNCNIMMTTLSKKWNTIKSSNTLEVTQEKKNIEQNYSELEILENLIHGINPFTGEVFDRDHTLNNSIVKDILHEYYQIKSLQKKSITNRTKDDFNEKPQEAPHFYKWGMNCSRLVKKREIALDILKN